MLCILKDEKKKKFLARSLLHECWLRTPYLGKRIVQVHGRRVLGLQEGFYGEAGGDEQTDGRRAEAPKETGSWNSGKGPEQMLFSPVDKLLPG